MPKNVVALIPLRGGSKSIPRKNIRTIAGKPLAAWVIEAALGASFISRVVVSTEDEEIAGVVRSISPKVEVLSRPIDLATDTASTESVMGHAFEKIPCDILVTLQATSPLTTPEDLERAWSFFQQKGADSLVTGVRIKRFFWDDLGRPVNYDPLSRPRRQDFRGWIMENGAFYFTRKDVFEKSKCRLGGKVAVFEMPEENAVEIDEPADWDVVEQLLAGRGSAGMKVEIGGIKLVVLDVDGTLTDGGMYYSREGDMLRKFHTRDAKGLSLLREKGIEVALLSTEPSGITEARARKLGISKCFVGVDDKRAKLDSVLKEMGLNWNQVAYMGDDINDLDCLKKVGISSCPSDAVEEIKSYVQWISPFPGGRGAVRWLCERILASR